MSVSKIRVCRRSEMCEASAIKCSAEAGTCPLDRPESQLQGPTTQRPKQNVALVNGL
jgi:hypothetical protein